MADTFARQRQLIGSTAAWAANDIVPALGEIAVEQVSSTETKIKIGDGAKNFSALPYVGGALDLTVADARYILQSNLVTTSAGVATQGKVPQLNAQGKIDGSMITLPAVMVLKGSVLPTSTAPAGPTLGDVWVVSAAGALDASWGIAGNPTLSVGDIILRETATSWIVLPTTVDLALKVSKAGDTMTGALNLPAGVPTGNQAVSRTAGDALYVNESDVLKSVGDHDVTAAIGALVPKVNDVVTVTKAGTPHASWAGLPGPVHVADQFMYNGTAWIAVDPLKIPDVAVGDERYMRSQFLQAGTGAVARTAQAKMREFLTPEDFGAVGDNTTDDTAAMTAAMTAAVSSGLRLRLKDGASYFLSTWGTFTNSGVLRIDGNATLRGPASTVTFLSPAANFYIQGVTFSTWASVVSRAVAQSGSFTDVVFSNNRCSGCTAAVFNIERPVDQYRVENNDIESCTGGYGIRVGENTYANQDTWQKGWIRSNRIKSLSASGTTSAVAVLVYGHEVTIADNKIDGVTQSGAGECWGIYTKTRYAQVYGNYVNNVVAASNADNAGINIKGTTRPVTSAPQGFAVIVWGNHVRNVGAAGVRGGAIRAQTDDVLIFGNQCEDSGLTAFATDESTAYRNVKFQNNLASWVSLVGATVGIRLDGWGTGVVADNNTVFNAANGVVLRPSGTGGVMQDAQVTRNRLFGCTFNIVFDAAAGRTLDRPVIESNVVDGGTYGLLQNSAAGTITNMRVRWNDLARAATPATGAALVTSIAQGNIGWLSASTTWDPPSIANGASTATTLTVGGAALGDAVVASFSNALGGLVLGAQVSAANAVEVRLINNSGGAVDLASGTLRVQVLKGIA